MRNNLYQRNLFHLNIYILFYPIEVKQEIMKYEKLFPTLRRIYNKISQKHSTMENHSVSHLKVRYVGTCFIENILILLCHFNVLHYDSKVLLYDTKVPL